jgi:ferredoxin
MTSPSTADDDAITESLTLILNRKKHELAYVAGDTVLDAARRGGLKPPFSCEQGNCASCMAVIKVGGATMRANNALGDDEVADGLVLTCQALPIGRHVTIDYDDL